MDTIRPLAMCRTDRRDSHAQLHHASELLHGSDIGGLDVVFEALNLLLKVV